MSFPLIIQWTSVVLPPLLLYATQFQTFPSFFRSSKPRTQAFYYILVGLVGPVWAIPFVTWVWAGWWTLWALRLEGGRSFPATFVNNSWVAIALTGWCFLESIFIVYHTYQAYFIQYPTPARDLSQQQLEVLFLRILQAGLDPCLDTEGESGWDLKEGMEEVGDVIRKGDSLDAVKGEKGVKLVTWLDKDDPRAISFAERLRTWFFHAPWESVQRENILDWIAWSSFNCSTEDAIKNPLQKESLDYALELISRRTGTVFKEGRNKNVKVMRLTLDTVHIYHRLLVLYVGTAVINIGCEIWCWFHGMRRINIKGVGYMVRIPVGWTPQQGREEKGKSPIVFLHGLGFGFLQNQIVIGRLVKRYPSHPIMVVVQPHISMNLFHPNHLRPIPKAQFTDSLATAIERFGFYDSSLEAVPGQELDRGGVVMFSHSKGSTGHSWLVKARPELIKKNCFADPVVFCLWEGDVCFNFVYRQPSNAIELLLSYFIGSELGIANTISRNFDWSSNTLFFDDIPHLTDPHRTAFFLGGKDVILDAHLVKNYLESHGAAKCIHFEPTDNHGSAILGPTLQGILKWISGEDD